MGPPEPRKYRHVMWHSRIGRWIAQVHQGKGGTLGTSLSQDDLARLVARHLGTTVKKLEFPQTHVKESRRLVSKYRCVVWKRQTPRRAASWQVSIKGKYMGIFPTELAAAKEVVRLLKLGSVTELLKKPAQYLDKAVARFKAMRAFWSQEVFVPGDLESAIAHRSKSAAMFKAEPALEVLSVQGKYGPWKDKLLAAWLRSGRPRAGKLPLEQRAGIISRVLRSACQDMSGEDLADWVQNCGRSVTHHSGFLSMLVRLRVVHLSPRGALALGVNGARYAFTGKESSVQVSESLACLAGACDDLQDILAEPPQTGAQWLSMYDKYCAVLTRHRVARMGLTGAASYLLPWTFRVLCISRMRARGIRSLTVPGLTLAAVSSMFPDQGQWIKRLAGLTPPGKRTIETLIQVLGYTGPVELLTMYMCLCQDQALRKISVADLECKQGEVSQFIRQFRRVHKMTPHPAVVGATLCRGLDVEKSSGKRRGGE